MVKDKRHKTVKILVETGNITEFRQIFDHIPKTTVADELGIHFNRMKKIVETVKDIKVGDIFIFSDYFEMDAKVLFELIYNQKNNLKESKSKRKAT